jgi:hypothetical protein
VLLVSVGLSEVYQGRSLVRVVSEANCGVERLARMGAELEAGDVLRHLDLGNAIAEFDSALERYFVETDLFRKLYRGEIDIVAGDKGTGKTALFRVLHQRYASIPEMARVEVVPAFNIAGNPIFQRINEGDLLTEGQYQTLWKAFFLSLAGNWVLQLYEGVLTETMEELERLLVETGLRSADDEAATIFSTVLNLFRRLMRFSAVEGGASVTAEGLPIVTGRVEFNTEAPTDPETQVLIAHDDAFRILDRALQEVDLELWLVMDRLDEAFAGLPAAEVPALRALLRTYLDLAPYEAIRLKLFLRKDLFSRIISGGFVNLTHVNARKQEIVWDEESLYNLLFLRIRENEKFMKMLAVDKDNADAVFNRIFTEQIDPGERKPSTWRWMMSRIRDGNDVKPPRNLIDLAKKAQEAQLRREEREHLEYQVDAPLVSSDSVKNALSALSKQRIEDTLLAEAGEEAILVERFRNSKAEHNEATLGALLKADGETLTNQIRFLRDIGFLELVGSSYKVPMLYRDGLGITQGRAFATAVSETDDEE